MTKLINNVLGGGGRKKQNRTGKRGGEKEGHRRVGKMERRTKTGSRNGRLIAYFYDTVGNQTLIHTSACPTINEHFTKR